MTDVKKIKRKHLSFVAQRWCCYHIIIHEVLINLLGRESRWFSRKKKRLRNILLLLSMEKKTKNKEIRDSRIMLISFFVKLSSLNQDEADVVNDNSKKEEIFVSLSQIFNLHSASALLYIYTYIQERFIQCWYECIDKISRLIRRYLWLWLCRLNRSGIV